MKIQNRVLIEEYLKEINEGSAEIVAEEFRINTISAL